MGMSSMKISRILTFYDKKAEEVVQNILPPTCNEEQDILDQFGHIKEMIPKVRKFLEEGRRDKVMRWLGFMQGVFYSRHIFSIEQMADHNRPTRADLREQNPGHSFLEGCSCENCKDYATAPESSETSDI